MSLENALILTFKDKLARDVLVIPSLPEVAMSVCDAVESDEMSLRDIGELISRDAGMAARMIKLSNSALFGAQVKAITIQDAANRIGLKAIRTIALAMAMEQLYVSQNEVVFELLENNWKRAMQVACSASALLSLNRSASHIDMEVITLAGVVHNIGVLPVLFEMERLPKVSSDVDLMVKVAHSLKAEIGMRLLEKWDFDPSILCAVKELTVGVPPKSGPLNVADFICAAAIATGAVTFPGRDQASVLAAYIERGVLADESVLSSPEYLNLYRDMMNSMS
ncbi:HDOD domain-containing protein [Echinimonas agarilytica]|uniref:HDOD domain-containing protein n=1 Tax=Echinimonas agarilytica TaxID=1215918 RepID=A0AA41W7T1_9GAMM|nr:HDOD domain-containing protein [Echinimonas agarilytica]MCM2679904.1 HDOD domain-containing protein [Echinimonas agarilytica]